MASNTASSPSSSCLLCYEDNADPLLGEFIPKYSCHLLCLRFASGISNKKDFPTEKEVIKEVNRVKKKKCKYCSKPRASLGCAHPTCRTIYHLGCAKKNDTISIHDTFLSYCDKHCIRQTDDEPNLKFKGKKPCTICEQKTKLEDSLTMKCCRKICHFTCIQDEAILSKQYCPKCRNSTTEKYIYEMLYYGIYFKGYDNERGFIKKGQTSPSQNIEKLLEQKTKKSVPKKLTQTSQTKMNTEKVEIKAKVVESKTEALKTTPEEVETEEKENMIPAANELEMMEDCEAQDKLVDNSEKQIHSCSKESSADEQKIMEDFEAEDELLKTSEEEIGSESNSEAVKTKITENVEEIKENSAADETEIDSCSEESNSEAVNTKITKNDIEEVQENSAADEQEMKENCEAQNERVEKSERITDSCSKESNSEVVKTKNTKNDVEEITGNSAAAEQEMKEDYEAQDELLETSEIEIDSCSKESNSEAVNTNIRNNDVEEIKENSSADEQEIMEAYEAQDGLLETSEKEMDLCSKESVDTTITNNDVEEIKGKKSADEQERIEDCEAQDELVKNSEKAIDSCSKETNSEAVNTKITKNDVEGIKENSSADEQKMLEVCEEEMQDAKTEADSTIIMETDVNEIKENGMEAENVEEASKNVFEEEEQRKPTETFFASAIREKDDAKVAFEKALATEKAAADNIVSMVLLGGIVCFDQKLKTQRNGYKIIAHLAYFEKYIEIRKRKGTQLSEILENCLNITTVEECLQTAVNNKLMKIKADLDGEEHWYIDDTLEINGVKIKSLVLRDTIRYARKSAHKVKDAVDARIAAEKALTACTLEAASEL